MNDPRNVIIIGSGPAGYAAAIYTARAQLQPLVFAGETFGGQLMSTTEIENYPGFENGIMGPKLMMEMRAQAQRFGAEIVDKNVTAVDFTQQPFSISVDNDQFFAKSVIIATGAEAITLGLPNEKDYIGRGVSTCAVCDATFYKEKTVYVIGGGDSAMEDTLALTKFAAQVFVVVRKDTLRASKIMQQRITENKKVTVLFNHEVIDIEGEQKVERLTLLNNQTNEKQVVDADGLFYAIGHKPVSKIFENKIQLEEKGYILTSLNGLKNESPLYQRWLHSYPSMTSNEGVFAAGDVVDFRYKQAITAAGLGTMAALDVEKWLENKK